MKIPETSANIGAYYGNEENGQWQPNGVIIDNGVGGGGVGSGDAGIHRAPLYPVHMSRHVPAGYVMAGAYYPPQFGPPAPPQPEDFEDYMWMENEDEFDKQVIQQLEEEALMEQCIEAMLEEEQREKHTRGRRNARPRDPHAPTTSSCNGNPAISLEEAVSKSTLNPLAAEFVPTRIKLPPTATETPTEEKQESTETASTKESRTDAPPESEAEVTESKPEVTEHVQTEESLTPPKDPPEVSATDGPRTKPRELRDRKPDVKKTSPPAKVEVKKVKPVIVKSESKVQPKKKEVKEPRGAKSEQRLEETKSEETVDVAPQPELQTTDTQDSGPKPINYAAAAKATKPKPKAASPAPAAPPADKTDAKSDRTKVERKPSKEKPKEKPRKNSTK